MKARLLCITLFGLLISSNAYACRWTPTVPTWKSSTNVLTTKYNWEEIYTCESPRLYGSFKVKVKLYQNPDPGPIRIKYLKVNSTSSTTATQGLSKKPTNVVQCMRYKHISGGYRKLLVIPTFLENHCTSLRLD